MHEPKISSDGNCLDCGSADWKLASVVVMVGTSSTDSESVGGGYGVSAGVGAGQRGVAVNYQNITLNTQGTTITALAKIHTSPIPPVYYDEKASLMSKVVSCLDQARYERASLDVFAVDPSAVLPLRTTYFGKIDGGLLLVRKEFDAIVKKLTAIKSYERDLKVWEKSRICMRCNCCFISVDDIEKATSDSINIPEFAFPDDDEHCPKCRTYQWKSADAYYLALSNEQNAKLESFQKSLPAATEQDNDSSSRIAKLFKYGLFTPLLSDVLANINNVEKDIETTMQASEVARQSLPYFSTARVCVECRTTYPPKSREPLSR